MILFFCFIAQCAATRWQRRWVHKRVLGTSRVLRHAPQENARSGAGVGLVVDLHQLADGGVGVLLRGGKRAVAEELLNGAQVGAVGQEMGGKSVAEGMWMQIPIHVGQAGVFLDDASHGTRPEAASVKTE